MEREFLLRKLIEHEPSTVDLIEQNTEQKYKKRKNSSSDASSIIKPLSKKMKNQQLLLKKHPGFPNKQTISMDGNIKQEIKQENLTSYDDNACNYMMTLK